MAELPKAVHGREPLLKGADADPFVSCFASADSVGYVDDGAVVWLRRFRDRRSLMAAGPPDRAARLCRRVMDAIPLERFTVPSPIFDRLSDESLSVGGRWRWFHTYTAPPVHEVEDRCSWLTVDDYDTVNTLLDDAFPTASRRPDPTREGLAWFGARNAAGALVACGSSDTTGGIGPMLGSIAVHPKARRQGLASGLTSWVTRLLLESGHPQVALGSYEGEDATHRLYRRLGYHDPHVLVSGRSASQSN